MGSEVDNVIQDSPAQTQPSPVSMSQTTTTIRESQVATRSSSMAHDQRGPMLEKLQKLRQHLLTGVSFAIPFIACGGIMIAFAIAFAPMTDKGPDFSGTPTLKLILDIGSASFSLLLPVLAGYIAYAVAGKPGLVPGFIG